jgi:hypothetical protein
MTQIKNWRDEWIEVAQSRGGVQAVVDPWHNVIRTGIRPWPAPELLQKLYQSRQVRAFSGAEHDRATATLGFYSDLQSLHSEDAITWSVFGPLLSAAAAVRQAFVAELLRLIRVPGAATGAHLWLWRRLPHPDTLVPGGPEIDFGVQTDEVFLLGEAKWRSPVGAAQGVHRDKDQMTLRREFCDKYGRRLLPHVRHFVVLGMSWQGGITTNTQTEADGVALYARDSTWQAVSEIPSHPCHEELRRYLHWKMAHSQPSV